MSCESLMKWAAQSNPQEIVQCVAALDEVFPLPEHNADGPWGNWTPANDATIGALLRHTAMVHDVGNTPITVVGLRRANVKEYVESFLINMACWHRAPSLWSAVQSLRAAELTNDALSMLRHVGSKRQATRVLEVVAHFDARNGMQERNAILKGMASEEKRFMIGISGLKSEEAQKALISEIPWPKRHHYFDLLNDAGYEELAKQIELPKYSDEPPF
ncbi:hypothetical protein HEK616_68160 [Streptomyces nigrescens]|uniref:Uncharacterized protein n=2 Tax=Streptomyces nigrescens TaxID=1920 RepID=A0ABM8A3S7_STRNI|nr:hypothetical protein HEK616_68160 [Streptomyces nigrescens]